MLSKLCTICQAVVPTDGGLVGVTEGLAAGKHRVVRLTQTDKPHDEAGYSSIIAVRSLCRLLTRGARLRKKSHNHLIHKKNFKLPLYKSLQRRLPHAQAGKEYAFLVPLMISWLRPDGWIHEAVVKNLLDRGSHLSVDPDITGPIFRQRVGPS